MFLDARICVFLSDVLLVHCTIPVDEITYSQLKAALSQLSAFTTPFMDIVDDLYRKINEANSCCGNAEGTNGVHRSVRTVHNFVDLRVCFELAD